jgi:4-carboxymuconolactone decarboxylase
MSENDDRRADKAANAAEKMTPAAREYLDKLFPDGAPVLTDDPEFSGRLCSFAFDEVVNHDDLDDCTRLTAILAVLIGCQGIDAFGAALTAALNAGVTPVEIRETVYQSVDYCGIGRVMPFIRAMSDAFAARGIKSLPPQATTTMENRLERGIRTQMDIFGENMRDFWQSGPEETRHINRWLAENCFGDYYTRGGLDLKRRELITFCFLAAQGGCEPQLTAHAAANLRLGNDKAFLTKIVSQCLPYIGYPRTLNALRCLGDAAKQSSK